MFKTIVSIAAYLLFIAVASAQNFNSNSLGVVSNDANIYPAQVQIGGTATPSSTATVQITIGSATTTFSHVAGSGETLSSVVAAFVSQINASSAMQTAGVWSNQGNPNVPAIGINPRRNGSPVPVVSATATGNLTATVTFQSQNILDAGPIFYCNRAVEGQMPQPGDTVCSIQFGGPDTVSQTCCTVAYAGASVLIDSAVPTAPKGRMAWYTACNDPVKGYVCNVFQFGGDGIALFGSSGSPAPFMGPGTINTPDGGGFFIANYPLGAEGTWTPTVKGTTNPGAPTYYPANAGTWALNKRHVTLLFTVAFSSLGGATGAIQIGGFPIVASATSVGSCVIQQFSNVWMTGGYTQLGAQVVPGAYAATLVQSGSGTGSIALPSTAFQIGSGVLQGFCSYMT